MPLPFLGNKFSPKKGPPRKSASLSNLNLDAEKRVSEFGLDIGPIKAKLGDYVLELQDDGEWALESGVGGAGDHRELLKVRKQYLQLMEEHNLFKIKVELLLDMLSEKTAEVHLLQNENEQLKKKISNRKR